LITVQDTTPPEISGVPPNETVECDSVPLPAIVSANDNCDPDPVVSFSESIDTGTCPGNYTLTRTWTATDRCSNSYSSLQVLTVQDATDPVLAGVPADIIVECDAVPVPPVVTATDNCDPDPAVNLSETITPGSCPGNYTVTRTWTAIDWCTNSTSASQAVTVQDTIAPVLAGVPGDIIVECDAVPVPPVVTATDNCDPNPSINLSETITPGSCPGNYVITRTWTATDWCANSDSAVQTVTVQDTTAPTLAGVPADITVECDAVPEPPSTITASDNCDPAPGISFIEDLIPGDCPGNYSLIRTWTATDWCSNSNSEEQVITVQDTTPPVIDDSDTFTHCIWPPNHWYVCFDSSDFSPAITDNCSEPVTWDFVGCESDQPEDGLGDGHTFNDCVISPDGKQFCVRAERAGGDPAGRHYSVAIVATDACDNSTDSVSIGYIYVPHDMSDHDEGCIKTTSEGYKSSEDLPFTE
jgi:hypothetical protein